MRQLLLLRHAKSSWDDARLTDHARPLNMRGRKAADAITWAEDSGIERADAVYTELKSALMPKNAAEMFEAFYNQCAKIHFGVEQAHEDDDATDNAGVTVA
jgi:phosphohistidine phosphatase SixA